MGILTWLQGKLSNGQITMTQVDNAEFWGLASSIYVRELAFQSCVNIVSKAVSKCEFKTYKAGKEKKDDEYYRWNYEPNQNQCSSVFLNKLIAKLYSNNEALIVQTLNGQRLVADSYQKNVYALLGYTFSSVTVDDYTFPGILQQKDVFFFQLNNKDVKKIVDGLQESYGKLAEYAQKAYQKSRGQKGVFAIGKRPGGKTEQDEKYFDFLQQNLKKFFEADSAALPLNDGQSYTELQTKTYNADSTRDIRAQIDDIFVFYARAFGIPPVLVLGDVADTSKAIDALLTFCIDPLTDILSEEINRKVYGKEVLIGDRLVIDTKTIKHIDLLSVAAAIDKLIGSGCFCINDIRKALGEEPINEPWAYQHFMTKNYQKATDAMNPVDPVAGGSSGGDANA